jgi:uncharacterized membrane protein YccC
MRNQLSRRTGRLIAPAPVGDDGLAVQRFANIAPDGLAPELVMNSLATQWRSLRGRVWEHRGQLRLALRATISAVLAFALGQVLHVPLPLWTVLTAVLLTQVTFGRSVKATIDYFAGTLCGAIYAGAVAVLLPHATAIALAGALAITVAPLALLAAINPVFSAATFTGVLVLLVPGLAHVGPVESAVYRVIEVAVGGLAAVAVSLFVAPARAHALAIEAAARMLELMARCLPELLSGLAQTCDASEIRRLEDQIGEALLRVETIAAEARHERMSFSAGESDLGPLLRTLLRLRHDLVMIGRAAAGPLPDTFQARFGPLLAQIGRTAADFLRQSGEALAVRRTSVPLDAVEAALDEYARAFVEARREGLTRGLPVDAVERFFTLSFALDQLRRNFRDLERCLRQAARWR